MSPAKANPAAVIEAEKRQKQRAKAAKERTKSALNGSLHNSKMLGLALFCSGMAGLIYQVLWIRQLTLVVGIEVYSITIAVSAFFSGLATGSALIGRFADRAKRPLLLYAALEAGIALTGVAATIALGHAAEPFAAVQSHAGFVAWAIPFLLVGTPAFLMGGTLPAAIRWQTVHGGDVAKTGGWAYAVNTAGAIGGALLSSFFLIAWLGVRGTSIAAALLNVTAAGLASALAMNAVTAKPNAMANDSPIRSQTALALYAIAGGIALGYEVVWSQAMTQFLSTRVFAFSVVLATYLAGLVLGSALYTRFADRLRDAWGTFGLLISAAGVVALLEIAGLSLWQLRIQSEAGSLIYAVTGSEFARMCARFAIAAFGIVFLPTILLGAAFPAALRLSASAEKAGRDVGVVLAVNTAGGILGAMLTGFLLVPALGLVRTLSMLAIAAAAIGTFAVLLGANVGRKTQWGVYVLGLIALTGGILTPSDRMARLLLTTRGGGDLIFYQEGRGATVAVAQQRTENHVFRRLYIQGVSNSGDAMPSLRYMRLQALLPLLIHRGEPKSALVIGFGTGITAGALLRYPQLERRVCVELLPAVVRAGDLFPENYKANSDLRLQIRIGDGRQEFVALS